MMLRKLRRTPGIPAGGGRQPHRLPELRSPPTHRRTKRRVRTKPANDSRQEAAGPRRDWNGGR